MTPLQPLWHCARPALAQSYLAQLGAGVITSTSIFAPRRTGKTVFLLKDLAPAAEAAGYRVAYVDLWQTKVNPALAIVRGLEEALEPKGLRERFVLRLQEPVKKLRMKGGVGEFGGEAEVEFRDEKAASADAGLRIDELISKIVRKRPLLLLVDEAQELARTEANEDVAKGLRTAITKHRERVRVLYTGSSRSRLAHMFSDSEAPLYAPGLGVVDFPLLGQDLVEFAADKFKQATGGTRTLQVDVGMRVLEQTKHRPEPFLQAVVVMLSSPGMTLEQATEAVVKANAERDDYEGTWRNLSEVQRQIVLLSRQPEFRPFARETAQTIARALGQQKVTLSAMQSAMRGLDDGNILSKSPRGSYEFEDHLFLRWVEDHARPPKPTLKRLKGGGDRA